MMRFKAILAAILICVILTPAVQAQTTAMGRYVEKFIPFPDQLDYTLRVCNDEHGNVVVYGRSGSDLVRCVLSEDLNWTVETVFSPDGEPSIDLIRSVDELNGIMLLGFYGSAEEEYHSRYGCIESGNFEKLELDALYRDINYHDSAVLLQNNGMLVNANGQGVYCYDRLNKELLYMISDADGRFVTANGRLFAVSNQNGSIIRADCDTGLNRDDLTGAPLTGDDFIAADSDSVYIVNRQGVYRVAQNGSVWEKLVDGDLCSLRLPSSEVLGFAVLNGDPVVGLFSDKTSKLAIYRYDETVQAVPSNELRIYTLGDRPALTQAAFAYQTEHPDYLVNVTNLLSVGVGATSDDVIRALNTELLAGGGPDIMMLDGMPHDSYIEKGVLADISEVVNSMNLLENVVESFTTDGKVYMFPTSLMVPVIIGDAASIEGLSDISDVAGLCEAWSGSNTAIAKRTMSGWFDIFCSSCYPAWFNSDGKLDTEIFAEFLDAIKTIYTYCGTESDEYGDEYDTYIMNLGIGESYLPNMMLMNGRGGRENELIRVSDGESALYPDVMTGFGLGMIELSLAESFGGKMCALPGQGKAAYAPIGLIGVNQRSAQKEAAFDFIRTILGSSVQDVELYNGFPVNSDSLKKCIDKEDADYEVATSVYDDETGFEVELSGHWPNRETREQVGELLTTADTPYLPDDTLLKMIKEELKTYFELGEDSQSAVNRINARLRAYLAE